MEVNIRQLKKWIAALDSGEYKQTKVKLQDSTGYCCLGVGCVVTIPESKLLKCDGFLAGNVPFAQTYAPGWLIQINYDFGQKTGWELTVLNDDKGFTFAEIATLLELVYIHKMLD